MIWIYFVADRLTTMRQNIFKFKNVYVYAQDFHPSGLYKW